MATRLLVHVLLLLPLVSLGFVVTPAVSFTATSSQQLFGLKEEAVFEANCDPDGFMTKDTLAKVPMIQEMLVRYCCYCGIAVSVVSVVIALHTYYYIHTYTQKETNDDQTML